LLAGVGRGWVAICSAWGVGPHFQLRTRAPGAAAFVGLEGRGVSNTQRGARTLLGGGGGGSGQQSGQA